MNVRVIFFTLTLITNATVFIATPVNDQATSPTGPNRELFASITFDNVEKLKTLVKKGDEVNNLLLLRAASRGAENCLKLLLELGADVNSTAPDGSTPLISMFLEPEANAKAILEILLKAGAKLNSQNSFGSTALMKAVSHAASNEDSPARPCIPVLLKAGADLALRDGQDEIALFKAIDPLDMELIALISKQSNYKSKDEDSPIYFAIRHYADQEDWMPVVEELLKMGWSPNITLNSNEPLLIKAVQDQNEALLKMLFQAKARLTVKSQMDETALEIAITQSNTEIAKMLIQAGADVNAKNTAGIFLLSVAKSNENSEIVALLLKAGAHEEL